MVLNELESFMMRFLLIIGVFFFNVPTLFCQTNFYPPDGNVGLGTLSPQAKLHVNSSTSGQSAILANGGDPNFRLLARQDEIVNKGLIELNFK